MPNNRPHPESERPLHAPLQTFDLEAELSRLREEREWKEGRRNAITLRKGEGMSVVLLAMKAGDRLEEHAAPGPISLTVREGRIRFSTQDETVEAGTEALISCEARVRHTLEALEDAVCVLTTASGEVFHR
ncbi:MAG: cupin domain-containing protein [Actinomycetota bacterium]